MNETIKYRGKTNLDFNLYWDAGTDFELGTGDPNVDVTTVAGINGDLLDFNGSYKSFQQRFVFYAVNKDTTADKLKRAITTWLLKNVKYDKLYMSMHPDYFLEASPNPSSVLKYPAYNKHFAKAEITFLVKPFMYRIDGQQEISIEKDSILSLTNPEKWLSYPLIHIKGNSNVSIIINNSEYKLTQIDREVYIDSQPEISMVYKNLNVADGIRNRNAIFPDHAFPELQPGLNAISITGEYESATIIPRWRTLC